MNAVGFDHSKLDNFTFLQIWQLPLPTLNIVTGQDLSSHVGPGYVGYHCGKRFTVWRNENANYLAAIDGALFRDFSWV